MALPKRTYIAPIVIAAALLLAGLGYLYYHQSSSHDCGPVQTKGVLKAKGEVVRKGSDDSSV